MKLTSHITSVLALAFIFSAGVLASPSAASAISCYDLAAYEAEPINAVLGISGAPATLPTLFSGICSNHGYLVDVTYRFDFDGDGTWDEENLDGIASYRFMEGGTYNPRLEVTDGYGRTASTTKELVIGPVTDLGYTGSIRIEVVNDFPWLLAAGAGALAAVGAGIATLTIRHRPHPQDVTRRA